MMIEIWSKLAIFAATVIVNGAILGAVGGLFDLDMEQQAIRTAVYDYKQQCGCARHALDGCGDVVGFPI